MRLLTAGLVTVLGLPAVAAAGTPGTLRVDNTDPAKCSDSGGQGTQALPFCTIGAAAAVAGPGQTVEVAGRQEYRGEVVLTRSGEPGRPITFRGVNGGVGAWIGGGLKLLAVHDVVVESFSTFRTEVADSSRVTVKNLRDGDLRVTGAGSSDVTLSGNNARTISVEAGAAGTTLVRNGANAIRVTDAPRTTVTNNTVTDGCTAGIELAGNSPQANLFNNLVRNHFSPAAPYQCGNTGGQGAEIVVSAASATGTRAGYNTVAPYWGNSSNGNAYSWAGTVHQTPQALAAATGDQAGGHDIVVQNWADGSAHNSAVTDSADATAPGFVPPAFPADDPDVENTGTGLGYYDRGKDERQENVGRVWLQTDPARAPYGAEVTLTATTERTVHWPTSVMRYRFDFGDGSPTVTSATPSVRHAYTCACDCTATVGVETGDGNVVNSWGTPLKVTTPGPLKASATVGANIPDQWDTSDTPPLGVRVDPSGTSSPWAVGKVVVDYGDGTVESKNGLDVFLHGYASPGDYTVKVTVTDSTGRTDTAAYPFRAAYAPSRFLRIDPYRLLDTRDDPAVILRGGQEGGFTIPTGDAPGSNGTPGSISSVVLNVTVTEATQDSHLIVWPAGQERPQTSNVNVAAGRTSTNLVTVPVGQAHRISTYLSAGQAEVIVDVVGFYRPNGGYLFTPLEPSRLVDTRDSRKLGAGEVRTVKIAGVGAVPADVASVVLNLTSTGTSADTHLSVYAGDRPRPISSNLNPEPGKDKSNQLIVPVGADGSVNVYNHVGSTDVILDVFGYYANDGKGKFTPTVPVRLTDTRSNPFAKPGPDSTTVVSGIPAGSTAAVLNVTATNTTADSYLTVHADGSPRPITSNLNLLRGATVPNHVTTPVSADGKVGIYNHVGSTDIIADLFGYFTDAWPAS
ncbi:hypothetical protein P3T27_002401 [Kitasatospora sp. MAA19]|uniref:PKD domain-containing protein n=1 Tax=Kitasatospora sp. MAA19 TaxID=3035090 RepID=UPI00247531BE|nr:PKD domain-containing protein [Kitasatospora sp. MAA19]MDH6705679.1 hypothetical protein [Kitasatospora sp. MAA19]